MAKTINIFNKSSVLPSIIEMEEELLKCENDALKLAGDKIHEAKKTGKKIIEETVQELPKIEAEKKKELLASVDATMEELKREEERELRELEELIECNRKQAVDFIVNKVIP